MQDSNRIAGVNYNVSNIDAVASVNGPTLYSYSYSSHPLYLQVQALERENSGLRAKLEALTGAGGGQFAIPRIPKSTALSNKVTRIVEEEVAKVTKKYNDAVARKNTYKKRYLKLISAMRSAKNSIRIVLDIARLHQHPTLLQAVHNIEDSLMLFWSESDISDYEQTGLEIDSAPQLPLPIIIQEIDNSKEPINISSPRNSPRGHDDDGQDHPYYGTVRMVQRTSALTKLPTISKQVQTQTQVQAETQAEKKMTEIREHTKRDSYTNAHLSIQSNPSMHKSKTASVAEHDGLSEKSYLANSSLLLALEKRVASEVADVVQSAYERHIRDAKPSGSFSSMSVLGTPDLSSSHLNLADNNHRPYNLADSSELLDRIMTPSLPTEPTSQSTAHGIASSSTHSVHTSTSTSVSMPVILPASALSNQSYESIEDIIQTEPSKGDQLTVANIKQVESVDCNTSLPSLSSSKHHTNNLSKSTLHTSQSISINSFICGINEIADDYSAASNAEGPAVVFSPRAEEYISQISSISTNNRTSISAPTNPINGSQVQQALKMHGSKVALSAVAKSVESDMFVSDVNVMKQTARQQQLAATRLLESKTTEISDVADPRSQDLESTESMGLIIDRSHAAIGTNNTGLSAYLSEALLARSSEMGITPDVADFCLSRPVTADQKASQHISASTAAADPSNVAVLTTAMLDQSPLVSENSVRSKKRSTPLTQSSSLTN